MTARALFVMVGGFLGAGKTTAIGRIGRHFAERGLRVGMITNDQGQGLVDTLLLGREFPAEEITGGCFCCRFDALTEAAARLSASGRPDVLFAEPVGSCTDLVATVAHPLGRMYGSDYRVAPLSVLVDPLRAERILDLAPGPTFSPQVRYVYRKQLEEADIIVVNKRDLVGPERMDRLVTAVARAYPRARLHQASARTGAGMTEWIEAITRARPSPTAAPDVDYDRYAAGEALLGWLNASMTVRAERPIDGKHFLRGLAARIREGLGPVEIAHLKMTLAAPAREGALGALSLVRSDGAPEISGALDEPLSSGELRINLRAETDPESLRRGFVAALSGDGWRTEVRSLDCFRPARPQPTHRMAEP